MIESMYQERRTSSSQFISLRGLRYHVRTWGQPVPGSNPLVLAHGWMDVAASWQFMVDALSDDDAVHEALQAALDAAF